MYVTRRLSSYQESPELAFQSPLDSGNSGILVIADRQWEAQMTCCWGICKDEALNNFPFPQNKKLTISYSFSSSSNHWTEMDPVFLIPVLDHPLSSGYYYVIKTSGNNKGLVCACSRKEDKIRCCFASCVKDVRPRSFDQGDIYQQMWIKSRGYRSFTAKSVAPDGYPPTFLRRNGWEIHWKNHRSSSSSELLDDAHGLDHALRDALPDLNCSATVVVGKWYCPFIFVKEEGVSFKTQIKRFRFYEMTLEQKWEEIYTIVNDKDNGNIVEVNVDLKKETQWLFGQYPVKKGNQIVDGFRHFVYDGKEENIKSVGLSLAIVERMKCQQEKAGWTDDTKNPGKVSRVEEFQGDNGWNNFKCYMLVEKYVLKRKNGDILLAYDFNHTQKTKCKWE